MVNDSRNLVLVVDDEGDIRALLRILLEREGLEVAEAEDGLAALDYVRLHSEDVSLIVLDIMMPGLDGISTAARLRELTDAPILFLTARSSDADKTAAYRNGGDDYIVKPFHATDLTLKIRAMNRRYQMYASRDAGAEQRCEQGWLMLPGGVELHPEEKTVLRGGERVLLTEREYALFACLCRRRGSNLTPAELYEEVWGEPYLSTASNTVIVHIANLRRKLEADPASPSLIRTVWGKGYRID